MLSIADLAELISACNIALFFLAHVAELVDAPDSKSGSRKGVKVRFLSWAQHPFFKGVFLCPKI
jgi:hypothetical protein